MTPNCPRIKMKYPQVDLLAFGNLRMNLDDLRKTSEGPLDDLKITSGWMTSDYLRITSG